MNSSVKQPTVHRVGKLKLSIIMLLVITLPIGALMVAVLQTRYSDVNVTMTIQQQMQANHIKMHETNRQMLDDLYLQNLNLNERNQQVDDQIQQLFDLGYIVVDRLASEQDVATVFEYFVSQLTDEQLTELLGMMGLSNVDGTTRNSTNSTRGWQRTHLVFAMDAAWLTGAIASYWAGVVAGSIIAAHTAIAGPLAWLLATIAGIVMAYIVETIVNWFIRDNGQLWGFRYVIGTVSIPWFWSGDTDINILDILIMIISAIGGRIGTGTKPAGISAPRLVMA
ncbi:MAG: hypothetical protein LBK70_03455 [Clostridiales bacterium]|jgi:hypothetical protein|nr:hypothetical protein [Clostridiales bacterium]